MVEVCIKIGIILATFLVGLALGCCDESNAIKAKLRILKAFEKKTKEEKERKNKMRYIRTEDGIYEYEKVKPRAFIQKGFYSEEKTLSEEESLRLFPYEIIKQAGTIEELCDEFVVKVNIHNAVLHDLDSALRFVAGYDYHELTKNYEIYGAIWTDKGLIYAAKMNEKGELELL